MTRDASRRFPGLLIMSVLLPLLGFLLAMQAVFDSLALWILFVVVAFAIFVVGVVTAAARMRDAAVPTADAARLDELEPLPPTTGDGDHQ
jgi:hypothetical protein